MLGGWLGRQLAERRMPEIQRATTAHALGTPSASVELLRAELGTDAVALGAATLPMGRSLSSGGQRDAVHPGR